MFKRAENLGCKVDNLFPGQGPAALFEIFFQRDPVDIFHDDILQLVRDRNIIYLDNIRVVQDRDCLGLVLEAAHQFFVVKEFFFQNLHGDCIVGANIPALVHIGHAAHPDQAFDQVTTVQLFANQVIHLYPPLLGRCFPRPSTKQ